MRRGRFHHRSQEVLAPGMLDGTGQLARLAARAQFGANVEPFHTASNFQLPMVNDQRMARQTIKQGEASRQRKPGESESNDLAWRVEPARYLERAGRRAANERANTGAWFPRLPFADDESLRVNLLPQNL